jgi:hypothetical protein
MPRMMRMLRARAFVPTGPPPPSHHARVHGRTHLQPPPVLLDIEFSVQRVGGHDGLDVCLSPGKRTV